MARFLLSIAFCVATLISSAFSGSRVILPGEYHLDWTIANGNITVTATAKTLGWVGFGISPFGGMMEGDLILSGRQNNGNLYIQDSYAFANAAPLRDTIQNVDIISATENSTHTEVRFTRRLDTGDAEQDIVIRNENQFIIWAWGPTDNLQYHGPNRGSVTINLVDSA